MQSLRLFIKSPTPYHCKWVTHFLWGPRPLIPSTPLLWPLPLLFNMGESSSLAKEQDITFSVLNDKKTFLRRTCQSGTFESQRPARWYLQTSSLAKHTCYLLTLLFCSFFATGSISTAAEPQSAKEIPTYVNGWIEDTSIYLYLKKEESSLHLNFLILQMTKGF